MPRPACDQRLAASGQGSHHCILDWCGGEFGGVRASGRDDRAGRPAGVRGPGRRSEAVCPAPADRVGARLTRDPVSPGRGIPRVRRHLRVHGPHRAAGAPREGGRRNSARHDGRRVQCSARRGVPVGSRTDQVGWGRPAAPLRRPWSRDSCGAGGLGDAADDRARRAASRGRRHRDASDVDRSHDRADRLLHCGKRPPRAARRRTDRDRNGRDRGSSRTPARSASVERSLVTSTRRVSGRRRAALCCLLRHRRPSSIRRRTSGR